MKNPILISIKCPECGAPVRYPEGAYTFKCPYCDSVLRTRTDGLTLKYIIPSTLKQEDILTAIKQIIAEKKGSLRKIKRIKEIKTFYKPFWYFKGIIYSCHSGGEKHEIDTKILYYTFPANASFVGVFQSLGVRSEVLTIEAYDSTLFNEKEEIIPINVSDEDANKRVEKLAKNSMDVLTDSYGYFKTCIIGEKYFIIYYPVIKVICSDGEYSYTFMLDGINKNIIEESEGITNITLPRDEDDKPYRAKLLSHRCNNCGYDLEPGDFDIIFYCKNCTGTWLLKGENYYSQEVKLIKIDKEKNTTYIPFWRFETTVISKPAGINMKTVGDLSKFMKMGQFYLRNEDPERPMRFFVPALVTRNARSMIKLAARIGIYQKKLPITNREDFSFEKLWNASLLDEEAEEMLTPIIFLVIGRIDRAATEFYNDFKVTVSDKQLVYYPFEDQGNFLLDLFHNYSFPKRSFDLKVY